MSIKIKNTNLKFTGGLSNRKETKHIILHHADAKNCDAKTIHSWHKNNGWAGIGYHFVVRKNGVIERGRPIYTIGAHCQGHNSDSIGICFEGNFDIEKMSEVQINAGINLLNYLYGMFHLTSKCVKKHKDFMSTDCPGKNFPFAEIVNGDQAVAINSCNIYKEQNTWKGTKSTVFDGETITILSDRKNGWSKVKDYLGAIGYMQNVNLELVSKRNLSSSPTRKITKKAMFRNGRKVSKKTNIKWLQPNTKFTLLEKDKKWVKISYNGTTGYVVKSKTNVK